MKYRGGQSRIRSPFPNNHIPVSRFSPNPIAGATTKANTSNAAAFVPTEIAMKTPTRGAYPVL